MNMDYITNMNIEKSKPQNLQGGKQSTTNSYRTTSKPSKSEDVSAVSNIRNTMQNSVHFEEAIQEEGNIAAIG